MKSLISHGVKRPPQRSSTDASAGSLRTLLFEFVAAFSFLALAAPGFAAPTPSVLVVGGGPDKWHNQAGIESNVRYVLGLFPDATTRVALFADGNRQGETVLCEDVKPAGPASERALSLLLSRDGDLPRSVFFRKPDLPQLDGAASKTTIDDAVTHLADETEQRPVILYFTGHGAGGDETAGAGSTYLLWHDTLTGAELSRQIKRLPVDAPVVVIMAQCFAGGFAPAVLDAADSGPGQTPRDLAGFFGATEDRVAAGCTPDIREADYQDFTSYFMAALSGRDRLGHTIAGADFNHDGEVGMDEAFCYALIHDPTIDVPVCTSDTFLRNHVRISDNAVFSLPFRSIRSWATPAQRAALDGLAARVVSGRDRRPGASQESGPVEVDLQKLYLGLASTTQNEDRPDPADYAYNKAESRYDQARSGLRRWLFARWPALRHPGSPGYLSARKAAAAALASAKRPAAEHMLTDYAEADRIAAKWESRQDGDARRLRLLRLAKTVALTHIVMTNGPDADRQALVRLLHSEQRPLFPKVKREANPPQGVETDDTAVAQATFR